MTDNARRTGPALMSETCLRHEAHYQLINWLMQTVERFPKAQKFLLGDRIQKTALDVLEALIEATYTRDRRAHLMRANLGLEKLRFFFRLAFEQKHLDVRRVMRHACLRHEHAARAIDEVGRLIGGWAKASAIGPAAIKGQANGQAAGC